MSTSDEPGVPGFVLAVRTLDDPDVVRMIDEVQAEYMARYGGHDRATMAAAEFVPPAGVFLVGVLDGHAVATGGWRRLSDGTAEIKRMYVAARARRRGLARAVLVELERTARAAGVPRVVLSTGSRQPEAVALYEQRGYLPVPGWGPYHYAGSDEIFLGKDLS